MKTTTEESRSAKRWSPTRFVTRAATLPLLAVALALTPGGEVLAGPDNAIAQAGSATRPDSGLSLPRPPYVGTVYCYACHQELALEFARTKMGKLFLVKPQNSLERMGCEECPGPASDHAESGGGLGVGGMAEFRIDHGQTIERNNRACLECHDEAYWHGGKTRC